MTNADLSNADMRGCRFALARMEGVKREGLNLSGSILPDGREAD